MPPMLFALVAEMDHIIGFSEPYHELNHFKQWCPKMLMSQYVEEILSASTASAEDGFITFAADNVDHNVRTLDGHETFHGMGFIAIVANIGTFVLEPSVRLQLNNYKKVEELLKKEHSYNIIPFSGRAWFEFIHI